MGQNCIRSASTRTRQGYHWSLVFSKIGHLNTGVNIQIQTESFTGLGEQTVRNFCNSTCVTFGIFTKKHKLEYWYHIHKAALYICFTTVYKMDIRSPLILYNINRIHMQSISMITHVVYTIFMELNQDASVYVLMFIVLLAVRMV